MPRRLTTLTASALALALATTASAAKIEINDTMYVDLHGYTQVWAVGHLTPADPADPGVDFYARRARLIIKGRAAPKLSFMFSFLSANYGMDGDYTPRMSTPDVFMTWEANTSFRLTAGHFIVPFSRGMQSGSGMHSLDLHSPVWKRKGTNGMRDSGFMARGLLFDEKIDYRVALTDGVNTSTLTNTDPVTNEVTTTTKPLYSSPRVMARVAFNVFDAEPGIYLRGTYLGKKKVLTFGLSGDLEPGVGEDNGLYYAAALDWFADIPMGDDGLVVLGAAYYWGPGAAMPEGISGFTDLGYRISRVEPLVSVEVVEPFDGDTGARLAIQPGLNYWINGHNASIKLQVGSVQTDRAGWTTTAVAQGQIAF